MELIISTSTESNETVSVTEAAFARPFNQSLVHQAVVAYRAGSRSGTKAQKNRSAVSGGGRKPWRQKGTGRARAGTIRSPIWRGGGVAFAASTRDYSQKLNTKMYRAALSCILSELVRQDRFIVLKDFSLVVPKTKSLLQKLAEYDITDALIVTEEVDNNLYLAARNIQKIRVVNVDDIDPINLIGFEKVVFTLNALKKVEERLL
jgi:large subunit ribosomal protein L4